MAIEVDGPEMLLMEPRGEEPGGADYIRPYTFTLMGLHDPCADSDDEDPACARGRWDKWERLGYVTTVEFRGELALNTGVDIWDEADSLDGDMESAAAVMYGQTPYKDSNGMVEDFMHMDMVLLHNLWLEPAYRGHGVAQHLFERALAFHNPSRLGCVLAFPNAESYFQADAGGRMDDPLAGACHTKGLKKLQKMLASWGFKALSDAVGDAYFLPLDDHFIYAQEQGLLVAVGS